MIEPTPTSTLTATVSSVADGILMVRLPLPFALDHINVWLLADRLPDGRDAWTIIDTGVAGKLTRGLWEGVVEEHMAGRPVARVIVTHFHPDHIGLADWLCRRFDATLWMTQTEWLLARMLHRDDADDSAEVNRAFYTEMGLEAEALVGLTQNGNAYARGVPAVPARFHRLRDGQSVRIGDRDWTIITSGGHSPEHACLFSPSDNILIAGDMVLPRISPNVSVWSAEPFADPLREFLDGLSRLRTLPAGSLVLPSHGMPFASLHERIDALTDHHRDRLDDAVGFCRAQPRTNAEVTRMLFKRSLDTHQLRFAAGEALAHLNHLVELDRLHRCRSQDGVWLYSTAD